MQRDVESVFSGAAQSIASGKLETSSPVVLMPYTPAWPLQFASIERQLAAVWPKSEFMIEHIGSTAVPGMAAKPIIDVMLGALSLAAIEAKVDALAAIGFHYVPAFNAEMPMRRYFVLPMTHPRLAHLHAVVQGGTFWCDHLLFRDALRCNPELFHAYAALKQELAEKFPDDSWAYAAAKSAFVQGAVNHARMAEVRRPTVKNTVVDRKPGA